MKNIFAIILLCIVFISCTNKEADPPPSPGPTVDYATVTTQTPTNITTATARFNGTVVSMGGGTVGERGFCWGLSPNPTLLDNRLIADGSGTGAFLKDGGSFSFATTYNVRAYAINEKGVAYGNNVSFISAPAFTLSTFNTLKIGSFYATLKGNVQSTYYFSSTKGFCYSTSPNPTLSNSVVTIGNTTMGDFEFDVSGLQFNTTYYIRSFGHNGNPANVIYGNEISFKTTGAAGVSGGLIFYDKGEVTDGWRYLEVGPLNISYNGIPLNTMWGCPGVAVNQTVSTFGKGLENTTRIMAICPDANCAARVCRGYTINGLSDWFLGSLDEMKELHKSTVGLMTFSSTGENYWTSTEFSTTQATSVYMPSGSYSGGGEGKGNARYVRPIRRF